MRAIIFFDILNKLSAFSHSRIFLFNFFWNISNWKYVPSQIIFADVFYHSTNFLKHAVAAKSNSSCLKCEILLNVACISEGFLGWEKFHLRAQNVTWILTCVKLVAFSLCNLTCECFRSATLLFKIISPFYSTYPKRYIWCKHIFQIFVFINYHVLLLHVFK